MIAISSAAALGGEDVKFSLPDHVDLAAVEESAFDETVTPIWEQLGAIGRSAPDSAWEEVPTDLSLRIDEVAYGGAEGRK